MTGTPLDVEGAVGTLSAYLAGTPLLSPTRHPPPSFVTVTALTEALHWANSQGLYEYSWDDIREREYSRLYGIGIRKRSDFAKAKTALLEIVWPLLGREFESRLSHFGREVLDHMGTDLAYYAVQLISAGPDPQLFYGRLVEIYARGLWPCGWRGNYPRGRFVVYYCGVDPDAAET